MSIHKIVLGLICIVVLLGKSAFTQTPIPYGLSLDSIIVNEVISSNNIQHFHCYKPQSYDSLTSPILFAIHGVGGDGTSAISDLIDIAERRKALIIAPNYAMSGYLGLMRHQEPLCLWLDLSFSCAYLRPATVVMNYMYQHVLSRESRLTIPTYMIGFSAGGQFVTRYMLVRQAYLDSIPLKMAVSSNAYSYTFPTDTLNGVAMPWTCGLIYPAPVVSHCEFSNNIYSWDCPEHIIQYYNENYAVLIGNGDIGQLNDTPCLMEEGNNRYERALNFYNFADTNAISRGTNLRWIYQEVQGVGHNQYLMYNSKASPTDTSTIAETLLFDSPYQTVNYTAPNASFYSDTTVVELGDSVHFINTSINAANYAWNFGDSTLSTDVSPWHIYSAVGIYNVMLTAINSNGCDNWNEKRHYIEVINPSSLSEIHFDKVVNFHPNPAEEKIMVSSTLPYELNVALYDINGKQLDQFTFTSNKEISLLNFEKGVYLYKVFSDTNFLGVGRFIKQ